MKVTVKKKEVKENHEIPFDEIPVGAVYVVKFSGGVIALKLNRGEAVLLNYDDDGLDWFELADGFKGEPAYKILGKLTEIVVEEY